MLTIRNLNKNFGKKKVLESFTYDFDCGVYGLLGPNGAGKTTLLRCMTKIYDVKKGVILYNDHCICKDSEYLSNIGYLPQKFGLFKDLKVMEMMRLLASLKNIDYKKANAEIEQCIDIVNLSDRIHDRVGTLSGGMIRRLGIAQTLLGNPEIIILDEPTAGLDPEERLRFKNIISRIKKDKIVIISTHIVEDVEAICDTVLVMRDGTVGKSGSCSEIQSMAEGKTYLVPEKEEASIQGDYVIQKREERDGEIMLKVIANLPQAFQTAAPNVEDGYICVLKNI